MVVWFHTVPLLRLNSVHSSLVFFQVMYTFRVGYSGQQVDVLCVKGDYAVDMYDCFTVIDDHLMYVSPFARTNIDGYLIDTLV
jgi:hypothetical protein